MADYSTTLPNPHEPLKPFIIVHFPPNLKLSSTNYLGWRTQIEATLEGYDLFTFLDGTNPAPASTFRNTKNVERPNPAHFTRKRQDRLLYGALLSTLSPSITNLVTQAKTTKAVWDLLKQTYGTASRSHIKQIRYKLTHVEKGNQSIFDYMQGMKSSADLLASHGAPVSVEDFTEYVLNDLDDSFQSVIDGVNSRDSSISFEELHEKLIIKEMSLKTATKDQTSVMALNAQAKVKNKGDSRAVLATTSDDGNLVSLQLTVDFKPNPPGEIERIVQCNGRVFCLNDEPGVHRVWLPHEHSPGPAMSRAFGDYCVKAFGLISEPDVILRNISNKDQFLVVVTDGVWDVVSNQEAVQIVSSSRDRAKAAERLVKHAAQAWRRKRRGIAMHDISAICLFFHSFSTSLPSFVPQVHPDSPVQC